MSYLPPFDVVKRSFELSTSKGQLMATASYENIIKMIRLLISAIDVDEVWYLDTYPDVAQAVRQGQISSAKEHFINNGYFEGRLPSKVTVDEEWYKNEYPDVAESIKQGAEQSAQVHFYRNGYKEGRMPHQH
ncbi:MAG: hypothetical protein ACJ8AI_24365 [Rhodopila sp.]